MKANFKSSEFVQGDLFDQSNFFQKKPEIAFSALQQIQTLRAKSQKKDASSILKEWVL